MTCQISRDPFARTTLMRTGVMCGDADVCAFCGQRGRILKSGGQRLWRYAVHDDGGHINRINKVFCGITCMRAYTQ